MKSKVLFFLLCLLSLNIMGQGTITRQKQKTEQKTQTEQKKKKKKKTNEQKQPQEKKCTSCGKVLSQCQHDGKHPKCSDCGKLIEDCQHDGKHPKCSDCGKLIEDCQHDGKHPRCKECGELIENCFYHGTHPAPETTEPVDTTTTVDVPVVEEIHTEISTPPAIEEKAPSRPYIRKSCIYVSPEVQIGSLMGIGASVGGYIHNFNIEGSYYFGLTKSEGIYWNPQYGSSAAIYHATYKPSYLGLKLGYGIAAGKRFRFTPQLGIGVVSLSGNATTGTAYRGYATTMPLGCKVELALLRHLSLSLAPEYDIALSKSSTYTQLAGVSDKINGWASGFNFRINLTVSF